ncbi:MAG: sensor domain-containing diguanylate cyclase [Oribacterium sp.]|nr:sensor domain-containing diguanylate cyclase [Oribacterium sp.]
MSEKDRNFIENIINESIRDALAITEPDASINRLLMDLGVRIGADRDCIFEMGEDVTCTYEWCRDENISQSPQIKEVFITEKDKIRKLMETRQVPVFIKAEDIEALRQSNDEMYRKLRLANVHSLVLVPILLENELRGFFTLQNPAMMDQNQESALFEIVAAFLAALLRHRDNNKRLRIANWSSSTVYEASMMALRQTDPDRAIYEVLRFVGRRIGGTRTYIFERHPGQKLHNSYEWCGKGARPRISQQEKIHMEAYTPVWKPLLSNREGIIIRNLETYRQVSEIVYKYLKEDEIASLIIMPIFIEGKYMGLVGVDNPAKELMDAAVNVMKLTARLSATLIGHRDQMRKVLEDSYRDQLTGATNRRGLERFLKVINRADPMGLIYCDLNGLKEQNDQLGHIAGDDMIRKVASLLGQCVDATCPSEVVRMGGDEFLMLCSGVGLGQYELILRKLRREFEQNHLSVAIGNLWRSNGDTDFDELLKEVDQAMYREKQKYYSMGHARRREVPAEGTR